MKRSLNQAPLEWNFRSISPIIYIDSRVQFVVVVGVKFYTTKPNQAFAEGEVATSKEPTAKLHLLYIRLPNKVLDLSNDLIYESRKIIVGRSRTHPSKPIVFEGKTVMDVGFQGTYFILYGRWFVVSKIRDLQGRHTGYYCDIVAPQKRSREEIKLTDLFLDLWVSPQSKYEVLDEDELEQALAENTITERLYKKAKEELRKLVKVVENGGFPPPLVKSLEEKMNL